MVDHNSSLLHLEERNAVEPNSHPLPNLDNMDMQSMAKLMKDPNIKSIVEAMVQDLEKDIGIDLSQPEDKLDSEEQKRKVENYLKQPKIQNLFKSSLSSPPQSSSSTSTSTSSVNPNYNSNTQYLSNIDQAQASAKQSLLAIGYKEVRPEPGFVIKTYLKQSKDELSAGTKIFINVCHSPQITAPPVASEEEIKKAVNADPKATYQVPMSVLLPRPDLDKVGNSCMVIDVMMHTNAYDRTELDADYKLYIIELAIEWAEDKFSYSLSREFTIPKMKSKGTLRLHLIPPKSVRPAISEIRPKTTTATTTSSSSKINTQSKSTPFNSTSSKMLLKPIFEVTPFTDMFPYTHMITIHLPGVKSMKSAELRLDPSSSSTYTLNLLIPHHYELKTPILPLRKTGMRARFEKSTSILRIWSRKV